MCVQVSGYNRMSLFSGKCQELSPCAVSSSQREEKHHCQASAETSAYSTVHHLQPHSRKCSNASTAIEMEFPEKKETGAAGESSIQSNECKATEDQHSTGEGPHNGNQEAAGQSKTIQGPFSATR